MPKWRQSRPNTTTTCQLCGNEFSYYKRPSLPEQRYCSSACGRRAAGLNKVGRANGNYVERVESTCEICGKVTMVTPHQAETKRFCSRSCQHAGEANSVLPYRIDPGTGCWMWLRFVDAKGYARVSINGRKTLAHRAYYEQHRGPIPEGMELDHLCFNPSCVNPEHLEPVPAVTNHRRRRVVRLTHTDVIQIRALAETLSQAEIARRYGMDASHVSRIVRGEAWQVHD